MPKIPCYNRQENKNAAAYGCANTRKPAQVRTHLYNGNLPYPHGILYDIPSLFARVLNGKRVSYENLKDVVQPRNVRKSLYHSVW